MPSFPESPGIRAVVHPVEGLINESPYAEEPVVDINSDFVRAPPYPKHLRPIQTDRRPQ